MDKVKKGLIHAIASCYDCDFQEEDYQLAQVAGRKHYIKTGHTVCIETTYSQVYEKQGR